MYLLDLAFALLYQSVTPFNINGTLGSDEI